MAVVLVTGMSGTGKSAALAELARRGHCVVDTDYGGYSEEVPSSGAGCWEQLWRADRIDALLNGHDDGVLFISGCVSNQGSFYPRFDAVVVLTAPANVILERLPVERRRGSARAMPSGIGSSTTWQRLSRCCVRVRAPRSTRVRRSTRWWTRSRASRTPCSAAAEGLSSTMVSSGRRQMRREGRESLRGSSL